MHRRKDRSKPPSCDIAINFADSPRNETNVQQNVMIEKCLTSVQIVAARLARALETMRSTQKSSIAVLIWQAIHSSNETIHSSKQLLHTDSHGFEAVAVGDWLARMETATMSSTPASNNKIPEANELNRANRVGSE
jgi:hypothetical protein